jgi:hypothetical protein
MSQARPLRGLFQQPNKLRTQLSLFAGVAILSLAPGFSRVKLVAVTGNGYNRFPARPENQAVKTARRRRRNEHRAEARC